MKDHFKFFEGFIDIFTNLFECREKNIFMCILEQKRMSEDEIEFFRLELSYHRHQYHNIDGIVEIYYD